MNEVNEYWNPQVYVDIAHVSLTVLEEIKWVVSLIIKLIIVWRFLRVFGACEVQKLKAQIISRDQLHVEVIGHEEVEKLDIRRDIDKCERKDQDDLDRFDNSP